MNDTRRTPGGFRSARMRRIGACLLLVVATGTLHAAEAGPSAAREAYEQLLEWRYESSATPVPNQGTAWSRGVVSLRLEAGRTWLAQPILDGDLTGLAFEGEGVLRLKVPDEVELVQLRRFAEDEALEALEVHFDELIVRAANPEPIRALAGRGESEPGGPWERHRQVADRQDTWLRIYRVDVDSQVLSTLLNEGQEYLRIEVKSEEFGWITLELDSRRAEELQLLRFHSGASYLESWVSLDLQPSAGAPFDVEHVDIDARLVKRGKDASFSLSAARGYPTVLGEITARVRLRCLAGGQEALQLQLHPWAEVLEVRDGADRELVFIRDHIGGRSRGIDKRVYDVQLVTLLPESPDPGDVFEVVVRYEIEVDNYMPGRVWYPGLESELGGLHDRHTATVAVTLRDDYEVRGMGRRVAESEGEGERHVSWTIDEPQKMVTFVFNRKVEELTLERPATPEIRVFSAPLGHSTEARMSEIGEEVAGSVEFFQELFDAPLPVESLTAAMTQAFHGQAFDGFLHLSEMSALRPRTGPMELFVSHETAHQWWGHLVGWESYRDQWLSEGLAEYSALLYIEASRPDGAKLFREALGAMGDEVLGSIRSMMSPFARTEMALDNLTALDRVGPIAHGYRAATGEARTAYLTLAYHKAALVVHMLRVLSRFTDAGEEGFVAALRDFVRTHRGGAASTRDLQAAVERNLPGEWGWFFDQWIYRAAIPEYEWKSSEAPGADGEWVVTLEVEQKGVPEEFHMPVPVQVLFRDGSEARYLMNVDAPRVTRTIEVPSRPRKVIFNPDRDVLAKM